MQMNEITGDTLCTKPASEAYRKGYDAIFNKEPILEDKPKRQILLRNSGICAICKEELISYHRHDFVQCKCKGSFVDGGNSYSRAGGSLVDTSVYADEGDIETIREYFSWGTRGVNGDEPLRYVLLKMMTSDHIEAILETQYHIKGTQTERIFQMEMKYREDNAL